MAVSAQEAAAWFPAPGTPGAAGLPREAWSARAFTWLGAAIDRGVRQAMQVVVDRTLLPDEGRLGAIRRSAAPFLDGAGAADPARFLEEIDLGGAEPRSSESYAGPLDDGIRIERRIHRDAADPMLVEHWLHGPGRSRATVVLVHGFAMGNPRIDAIALQARDWFGAGLDVALLTLPGHGARSPTGARFSGETFATGDIAATNAMVRRSLEEILLLARMVRSETGAPVGILGQSLGGYLAALAAALDPDLAFVIPVVPPVCLGDLAWRFLQASRSRRSDAAPAFTEGELRGCFRAHSPLVHAPRVPRERLMVIGARGDRIVPPEHPQALWRHWGEPTVHWFSGSHLAPFGRRGVARDVLRHLRAVGL